MSFEDLEGEVNPYAGAPEKTLKRFLKYHEENPQVFRRFYELAQQMRGVRPKYSHWAIMNIIRWEHDLKSDGDDEGFKISNDYFAYYARLLIHTHPEFEGFFDLKPFGKREEDQ